jgi:phosphopentomutase
VAQFPRIIVIVLDSVGIGELDDAAAYGDRGSNTLGNIARRVPLGLATLRRLGIERLVNLGGEKRDREERGRVAF